MGACSSSSSGNSAKLEKRFKNARVTKGLVLSSLRLTRIPPQAFELDSLRTLDLSHNPGIDLSGIERLVSLRKLVLADSAASFPPGTVLPNLEHLDVTRCVDLSGLARLSAPKLATLIATACKQPPKPLSVRFPSLKVLSLRGCADLDITGTIVGLPNLQELDVSRCRLRTLAGPSWADYSELRRLDASHNAISITRETVPESLLVDTPVNKLALNGNPGASQADMMALPGYDAYAARRKSTHDRVMAGGFTKDQDLLSG